jgi:hypothetical protein
MPPASVMLVTVRVAGVNGPFGGAVLVDPLELGVDSGRRTRMLSEQADRLQMRDGQRTPTLIVRHEPDVVAPSSPLPDLWKRGLNPALDLQQHVGRMHHARTCPGGGGGKTRGRQSNAQTIKANVGGCQVPATTTLCRAGLPESSRACCDAPPQNRTARGSDQGRTLHRRNDWIHVVLLWQAQDT